MDYLTLYKNLLLKEVFRIKEVYPYTKGNKQVASNIIQRLLKKRLIRRIRHGFYYTVPLELSGRDFQPNPYLIAAKLAKKYFLSHYTALELHGMAQTAIHASYISVVSPRAGFAFKGHRYIFVKNNKSFGIITKKINDTPIFYTDIERTFLECLKTLKYSVSLEVFLKSFDNAKLNFNKMEKYLTLLGSKALYSKAGYVFSLLKNTLDVPKGFLTKLRKKVSKKTYYLESKAKGANKKNKEWNLMVPKNIEELMKVA